MVPKALRRGVGPTMVVRPLADLLRSKVHLEGLLAALGTVDHTLRGMVSHPTVVVHHLRRVDSLHHTISPRCITVILRPTMAAPRRTREDRAATIMDHPRITVTILLHTVTTNEEGTVEDPIKTIRPELISLVRSTKTIHSRVGGHLKRSMVTGEVDIIILHRYFNHSLQMC